jgi:alkaline phosphatase D
VLSKRLEAAASSDFSVRVLAEDLQSGTTYYYRFRAGADTSRIGRTRTAPAADADVEVRFAWACCQDYTAGFYGPYRQLLNDDAALPEAERIQFVLFLGDFIYETRDTDWQQATDDDLQARPLLQADGKPRIIAEFPSGGALSSSGWNYAVSLEDYRHLYKSYLSDPDLQEARAQWPFISIWDDHEFSNDCWQTQANYDRAATTDEPSQKRRVAASQAWFEYVPAALSDLQPAGDVPSQARDWKPVSVEDAPYSETVVVTEENNQKAISALTVYRNLRWGRHVELVVTDSRAYRSDHPVPEEVTKDDLLSFHPLSALPREVVNTMDAGRDANGGNPPDMVLQFPNKRKDSPPGSMLGAAQKQWWKDVMAASDATFKVWGNPVPLLRVLLKKVPLLNENLVFATDSWDGYNSERKELMTFLKAQGILNVVSLSGDNHAHYAGVVYDDYDAADAKPVMVDISTAGISSGSLFAETARILKGAIGADFAEVARGLQQAVVYDSTALGGSEQAVVNLNTVIRYGSEAAKVASETHDLVKVEAARDPALNTHLRYADTRANGYGLVHATSQQLTATLVTIERSFEDLGKTSPGIRGQASFKVARAQTLSDVDLSEAILSGKKPFPLA